MKHAGFLLQDPKTKTYRLGPAIVAAGNAAFMQFPTLAFARKELEQLCEKMGWECKVIARSNAQLVTLGHYQSTPSKQSLSETDRRLPNIAPLGACFMAWSSLHQLKQWLHEAHNSQSGYDEKLDQQIRTSVISIYKRGYEVTLKTRAETARQELLNRSGDSGKEHNRQTSETYQQALYREPYHLDHIDPQARYAVSHIAVPIFGYHQQPELVISVSQLGQKLLGQEIEQIALHLKQVSSRISLETQRSQTIAI